MCRIDTYVRHDAVDLHDWREHIDWREHDRLYWREHKHLDWFILSYWLDGDGERIH